MTNIQDSRTPWWTGLTRYHWFVLIVAALGWLFDTMDQQLFNLARVPAMKELLTVAGGLPPTPAEVAKYGGYATSIFLLGWATGGIAFGVLGDRIGRAKTMMWTILIYSICTGLSALSNNFWDFAFYRFITGLGVGGEFAVGVALVAEVMPDRSRAQAIGLLQALSTVGNITAALTSIGLGQLEQSGLLSNFKAWRLMFLIGAIPALLALFIRRRLKEPERWQAAKIANQTRGKNQLGSYSELFRSPVWRKRALFGVGLACVGVIGLWGIGFYSIDLSRSVLGKTFEAQGLTGVELSGKLNIWAGITSIMLNFGAFFGIYGFSALSQRIGRRPTFALGFVCAFLSTAMVFWYMRSFSDIFWMMPIMGFCILSLFGGYAVYFPELFPTHLRSTGVSFCYNVGRFVAALGPLFLGQLTGVFFKDYPEPMRYAGLTMCSVFLLGILFLPFLPETKGLPLPESDRGLSH
ncbi:MAG: MFS transporter [Pedosphaera sp.]|nr:MFS transporter [Pedosphaera sp.]